jgi:hypothetical protein
MEADMKKSWAAHYLIINLLIVVILIPGCGGKSDHLKQQPILLGIEKIDSGGTNGTGGSTGTGGNTGTGDSGGDTVPGNGGGLHPLFSQTPGTEISTNLISSYHDATGLTLSSDFEGDGVSNNEENAMGTNPFVTDYPRITVRTSFPVIMELLYTISGETKTYSEYIDEQDTKSTKAKNMDETHYNKLNLKTTPYVVKDSSADSGSNANSYGYSNSQSMSFNAGFNFSYMQLFAMGGNTGYSSSTSHSENTSFSNSFSHSSMSEKTVFDDVNYHDDMDSSGVELKDTKVMEMENKYRKSQVESQTVTLDKNAGVLRAALYFKNESIDKPVKISNVRCTALLKMPNGNLQVLSTFLLKDRDGYPFEVEIGGSEETPPYAVVVDGINSQTIKTALRNGYIPVISLFSYDMTVPDGSTYQPGVTDLKQVEEAAKKRTAIIKITAPNRRELYRVAAFDVDGTNVSPGTSLKKALFNIYRSPLKKGESFDRDANSEELTVKKEGLWWHTNYSGNNASRHEYLYSSNLDGNDWDYFATEIKSYTDETNSLKHIETIKRIGNEKDVYGNYINQKYNPFNKIDNPKYNDNESLSEDQLLKTKYWVIMHNGKFFEGDINDPIWAGDRYEIVLFNIQDFREHFQELVYTPLQSGDLLSFDTRWNALVNNTDQLARSVRLGKVNRGDVVQLDVYLKESRFLFDSSVNNRTGYGIPVTRDPADSSSPSIWWDFNYTFDQTDTVPNGIPGNFTHKVHGGVNSLMVYIEESPNTHYYILKIKDGNDAAAAARKVRIDAVDLLALGGDVYINSKTLDVDGTSIGALNPVTYDVEVFAHGIDYGHQVQTRSTSNGTGEAQTTIQDAFEEIVPTSNFSFNAVNLYQGKLTVTIQDSPNTEYYLIRCIGPFNYNQDKPVPVKNIRGHAGINNIDLDHPYNGMKEAFDPGVYEVHVYAINKYCYSGDIEDEILIGTSESRVEKVNVEVEYPHYINQRVVAPFKWLPEAERDTNVNARTKSFNLDAIDLEVNFNEGSGWYRLKLANDDVGAGGKEIECRFTSVVQDYRGQHFKILFKPPSGDNGSFLNVFKSSDDEVDVYIRTVAEKRYRDTFWMKKMDPNTVYQSGMNAIVAGSSVKEVISFWNSLDETDASKFEDSLASWRIASPLDFVTGLIAGLVEGQADPGNYFFSPLEERKYYISSAIANPSDYVETRPTKLDLPGFKATPGPGCIYLTEIQSRFADSYRVWWRLFSRKVSYEYPLTPDSVFWDRANNAPMSSDAANWRYADISTDNGKCSFTIPNCSPNQFYVVALVGTNPGLSGTSDARFAFDSNGSCDNIQFIMPYPYQAPVYAPVMSLATDTKTRNIGIRLVSPDADQNRFVIEWKSAIDPVWNKYDSYIHTGGILSFGGASYTIANLNPNTVYTVKAYALTVNNKKGPETIQQALTGIEGDFSVSWVFQNAGGQYALPAGSLNTAVNTNLLCNISALPVGTVRYTITGSISYSSKASWGYVPVTQRTVPLNISHETSVASFNAVNLMTHWWLGIFNIELNDGFYITYTVTAYGAGGMPIKSMKEENKLLSTECPRKE